MICSTQGMSSSPVTLTVRRFFENSVGQSSAKRSQCAAPQSPQAFSSFWSQRSWVMPDICSLMAAFTEPEAAVRMAP